jgi:hypothetical protein
MVVFVRLQPHDKVYQAGVLVVDNERIGHSVQKVVGKGCRGGLLLRPEDEGLAEMEVDSLQARALPPVL